MAFGKLRFGATARPVSSDDNDTAETTGTEPIEVSPEASTESELRNFRKQHRWDLFLDVDKLESIDDAIESHDVEKEANLDKAMIQEDSPYAEVRASVPNYDEDVPVNTLRAWVIGGLMCTIVAACNVLLFLRRSPISITSTVVQLASYP
jgi:hypothetical protein